MFPASLQPRLNFTQTREELKPATLIVPKAGVLHADDVRAMALVCLRLETLSASGQSLQQTQGLGRQELDDNRASRFGGHFNLDLLMPHVSPEMTDDDLLTIVNSRASPALSPCSLALVMGQEADSCCPARRQCRSASRTPLARST